MEKLAELFSSIVKFAAISISILVIPTIIFSIWTGYEIFWFDSTIEEISKKNKYIEIVKLKGNIINIEGKTCNSYLLRPKSDNVILYQPFEEKMYTRSLDKILTEDKKQLEGLCQKLNSINKGVPTSYIVDQVNNDNILYVLSSIVLEVANNIEQKATDIHLFVRGFADKSENEWRRELDKNYNYQEINYYKSENTSIASFFISNNNMSKYFISN